MIKYKHPTPISGYILFALKGDKIGEYRRVNPEDYVIDPNTGNRRNKYTGLEVTFIPEGFDEEGVVVYGHVTPSFNPAPSKQSFLLKLNTLTPNGRTLLAIASNNRNRALASYYFNQAPTISNLAKGVYHWYRSNKSENPEDYRYVTGIVDLPVSFGKVVKGSLVAGEFIPKTMTLVRNETSVLGGPGGLGLKYGPLVPTGNGRTITESVESYTIPLLKLPINKTFGEGVVTGYTKGIKKGIRQTEDKYINMVPQEQVNKALTRVTNSLKESLKNAFNMGKRALKRADDELILNLKKNLKKNPQDYVSKLAAYRYTNSKVKQAQEEAEKVNQANNLNKLKLNVNSVKSPQDAISESSTNAASKSNEKLTKFQKFKLKVKSKPVKYGLGTAGTLGLADIIRVSMLNLDPTRDAKLVPIEIFNWVSNGLMSKEGRLYKLVGDLIESLKNEQRLDSLKGVRDKMLSSQLTSSSLNAPNDTIGLNTMLETLGNSTGPTVVDLPGEDLE